MTTRPPPDTASIYSPSPPPPPNCFTSVSTAALQALFSQQQAAHRILRQLRHREALYNTYLPYSYTPYDSAPWTRAPPPYYNVPPGDYHRYPSYHRPYVGDEHVASASEFVDSIFAS